MLKIAGSVLVFSVSILYGFKLKAEYHEHVEQLLGMKEILWMLWGEISYARTPLKEAFLHISAQKKEPFSSFLKKAAEGMDGQEEEMAVYWSHLVEEEAGKFLFTQEERGLLKRVGENFGYLDVQMQLKNLELYIGQAETLIQKAQEELKDRQKLSGTLSLMGGLFLIVLLI